MKIKTKPGETVTFQPQVIDPMDVMMPLLLNRFHARKNIKLKIRGVTFNCFLWSVIASGGRVTIGIQPTGAPVVGKDKKCPATP